MGKAKKDTNVYVTSDQLYKEWLVWRQTGRITPKLGEYMLLISQGVMKTRSFNRYPNHMREDMVQEGVLKQVKNLHNLKPEKRQFFFAYLTRCVFTAAITYLSHYYKELNTQREMMVQALEDMKCDPNCPLSPIPLQNMIDNISAFSSFNGEGSENNNTTNMEE